ncbi:Transmembrane protein 53 [Sciurus carolinensis]|uniref:Transmembrane protein 53 n=1 Tax=Sciurus carolinensis TaxID=30640 RepID=A0AA41T532_SCICA|nr:Transmembrane protein 53 [Sciurus carolinensis]
MLCRGSLELLWAPLCFCHLPMVGTIFDSGPGDSNLVGALAALAVILDHQSALTHLWLLVTFTPVAVLFHILLAPLTALFHTPCFDELQNAGSRWPGLYSPRGQMSNLVGALAALAVILDHQSTLTHLWLLVTFTPVAVLFHILLAPLTALFHTPCFDELQNAGSRWPGLYFSSRADEVVLTRDVERMVEARLAHLVLCGLCVICTCQPLL